MKLRKKAGTPAGPHLAFFILNLLLAATLPGVSYGWSWDDKTGDVTLEPGVTRVTNADIPYVAALTGIEIPADASLVFENTQSLTLSASLSGAGEVSGTGSGVLELAADNRGHVGTMSFDGQPVTVTHRYGLGSATRTIAHKNSALVFKGNGLTNDVPVELWGNRANTGNWLTEDLTDPLLMNGALQHHGGYFKFGNWTFTGGVTLGSETEWSVSIGIDCHPVITNKPLNCSSYYIPFTFYGGTFDVNKSATLTLAATGNVLQRFCVYECFGNGETRGIVCGCENALDQLRTFGLGRSDSNRGTLNLNGFDQTTTQVGYLTSDGWKYTPVRGDTGACSIILSDKPATLTMTASTEQRVDYLVKGAVSITRTGGNTYTFVNRYCDTTGTLTMNNSGGAIAFDWEAGWAGDVDVRAGQVRFLEGTCLNREKKSRVSVADGAKLYITNGVALECASLTLGNNDASIGTYTKENAGDWIDGEGSIKVVVNYPQTPVRKIWKGTAGGLVTDGENWEDDEAPALNGGEVLVFSSATAQTISFPTGIYAVHGIEFSGSAPITLAGTGDVRVGPSGVASLSSAEGFVVTNAVDCGFTTEFPATTTTNTWTVGAGSALEIRGDIVGGSIDNVISLSGAGAKIFSGDNAALLAKFSFDEGVLVSRRRTALGSSARPTIVNVSGDGAVVRFEGAGLTNATPLVIEKNCAIERSDADLGAFLVFEGEIKTSPGYLWTPSIKGNWQFKGGIVGSGSQWHGGDGTGVVWLSDKPFAVHPAEYIYLGSSTWHFSSTNNEFNCIQVASRLVCEATNTLTAASDNGSIVLGSIGHVGGGTLDLNGFDQDLKASRAYSVVPTEECTEVGIVTSAVPAVLRFVTPWAYNQTANNLLPWRFCGQASLEQAGASTNVLIRQLSPSTGTLKVSQGRLELRAGAGWTNASTVAISGGTLYVRSDSAAQAFGPRVGKSQAKLSISGAGVLEIGGGTATVRELTIEGEDAGTGMFGSLDCTDPCVPAAHRIPQLAGPGLLWVKGYGTMLIVR